VLLFLRQTERNAKDVGNIFLAYLMTFVKDALKSYNVF